VLVALSFWLTAMPGLPSLLVMFRKARSKDFHKVGAYAGRAGLGGYAARRFTADGSDGSDEEPKVMFT